MKKTAPKPGWLDGLVAWVNALPIPIWLFYLLVIVILGLLNNVLYWHRGSLPIGQFEFEASTDGVWPVFFVGYLVMLVNNGKTALAQYRPLIPDVESSYANWEQEFTVISRGTGWIAFFFALAIGIVSVPDAFPDGISWSILDVLAGLYYLFIIMLAMGSFLAVLVFQLRQIRIIQALHRNAADVDLFDLEPTHAFSKLTAGTGIGLMLIASFGVVQVWNNPANTYFFVLDGVLMVLGILVFFLPLRGMRQKLHEVRAQELRKANQRLKDVYARLNARVAKNEYSDLSGMNTAIGALTQERDEIAGISTLPWDTSTFRSFVGSILLPIFLFVVTQFLGRFF